MLGIFQIAANFLSRGSSVLRALDGGMNMPTRWQKRATRLRVNVCVIESDNAHGAAGPLHSPCIRSSSNHGRSPAALSPAQIFATRAWLSRPSSSLPQSCERKQSYASMGGMVLSAFEDKSRAACHGLVNILFLFSLFLEQRRERSFVTAQDIKGG